MLELVKRYFLISKISNLETIIPGVIPGKMLPGKIVMGKSCALTMQFSTFYYTVVFYSHVVALFCRKPKIAKIIELFRII